MHKFSVLISVRQRGAIGIFKAERFEITLNVENPTRDEVLSQWQRQYSDHYEPNILYAWERRV